MTNRISFNMDMIKSGVTIVCMALVITFTTQATFAASASPGVLLNGSELAKSSIIQDGKTLVSVRDISDIYSELDIVVMWDQEAQMFTAVKGDVTITIQIGSNILTRNGEQITLDVPSQLVDGKPMVPLRATAESLGLEVNWDASTMTAAIGEKK